MRLLHTTTHQFDEFWDSALESIKYAILSHRWGRDEVSYHEFLYLTQHLQQGSILVSPLFMVPEKKQNGAGYQKIINACRYASKQGFEYIWIDTCCIDKSSSAELSEAINSMFKWYRGAQICYAYLVDVTLGSSEEDIWNDFEASEWFTRCWTLQELLAPRFLHFLDSTWTLIESRIALADRVSEITNIPRETFPYLERETINLPFRYAQGQLISWARDRRTSRTEDLAYSLMGLLGVNMPLLYGEGIRAFPRLLEESFRRWDDPTIFAHNEIAVLPFSPSSFEQRLWRASDLVFWWGYLATPRKITLIHGHLEIQSAPFLELNSPLPEIPGLEERRRRIVPLRCFSAGNPQWPSFLVVQKWEVSSSEWIKDSDYYAGQQTSGKVLRRLVGELMTKTFAHQQLSPSTDLFNYETMTITNLSHLVTRDFYPKSLGPHPTRNNVT